MRSLSWALSWLSVAAVGLFPHPRRLDGPVESASRAPPPAQIPPNIPSASPIRCFSFVISSNVDILYL